jgi:hypothetical protein
MSAVRQNNIDTPVAKSHCLIDVVRVEEVTEQTRVMGEPDFLFFDVTPQLNSRARETRRDFNLPYRCILRNKACTTHLGRIVTRHLKHLLGATSDVRRIHQASCTYQIRDRSHEAAVMIGFLDMDIQANFVRRNVKNLFHPWNPDTPPRVAPPDASIQPANICPIEF